MRAKITAISPVRVDILVNLLIRLPHTPSQKNSNKPYAHTLREYKGCQPHHGTQPLLSNDSGKM